jgi:hypothetical protein
MDEIFSSPLDWPLLERGWVFQERLLSPRVLYFAKDQMFWECRSTFQDEIGHERWKVEETGLDRQATRESPFINDMKPRQASWRMRTVFDSADGQASWTEAIANYSRLLLTKESDRLPALAGIVKRMMDHRKDDVYCAGMWKSTLLSDLAFHSPGGSRPRTYLPSWSWASMHAVSFVPIQILSELELVALKFTPVSVAHVGVVRDASILIRGRVISEIMKRRWNGIGMVYVYSKAYDKIVVQPRSVSGDSINFGYLMYKTVTTLVLGFHKSRPTELYGLLLEKESSQTFERIDLVILELRYPWPATRAVERADVETYLDDLPLMELRIV